MIATASAIISHTLVPTITPVVIPTPIIITPIVQVVQTHSSIIAGLDIRQYVGLSGLVVIESFVNYLQTQWKLPAKLAPVAALISGVLLNVAIAFYLQTSLQMAVYVGLVTGILASGYHEATK